MSAGPCGSQRHQSHDDGSSTTATRRQSAGPVHVASWMMSERTTDAGGRPGDGERGACAELGRDRSIVELLGCGDHGGRARRRPTSRRRPASRRGRPPTSPVPSRASPGRRRRGRHGAPRRRPSSWSPPRSPRPRAVWSRDGAASGRDVAPSPRVEKAASSRRWTAPARRPSRAAPTRPATHMPTEASSPTAPRSRNSGDRMTSATTTDPTIVQTAAVTPIPAGSRVGDADTGTGIATGAQRGNGRGVRCTVERHGSAGSAVSAAAPRVGPADRPTRSRLDPMPTVAPSSTTTAPLTGSPFEPRRDASSQLREPHGSVGGDVEDAVVRFERGVGQGHRAARRATDDVASGAEDDDVPAAGPASATTSTSGDSGWPRRPGRPRPPAAGTAGCLGGHRRDRSSRAGRRVDRRDRAPPSGRGRGRRPARRCGRRASSARS